MFKRLQGFPQYGPHDAERLASLGIMGTILRVVRLIGVVLQSGLERVNYRPLGTRCSTILGAVSFLFSKNKDDVQ